MEYLLATVKYGSFSATAVHYYTTQPTVSRQISLLEDELGYLLFNKRSKPLQLTEAGKILCEGLQPLMDQLKTLTRLGEMAACGYYGNLTLGFCDHMQIEHRFLDIIRDMQIGLTGLKLNFQKIDHEKIKDELLSRKIDVGITMHTPLLEDPELELTDICSLTPYILMSSSHPLAAKDRLKEDDLLPYNIYLAEPLSGYSIHKGMFLGYQLNQEHLIEVNSVNTTLLNIQFGNGVTLSNNFMEASDNSRLYKAFSALDESYTPKISIITRKNSSNPAIGFFRDLAVATFTKKE